MQWIEQAVFLLALTISAFGVGKYWGGTYDCPASLQNWPPSESDQLEQDFLEYDMDRAEQDAESFDRWAPY